MSGLVSNRSHIKRVSSRASAIDFAPTSSTIYLPTFTSETCLNPRVFSDCSTARPCGSRIPLRGVTKTFTCTEPPRPRCVRGQWRGASLSGSILHPAQHLLVPEAAGVGTNFITQQNLAFVTAEFELEVDQKHAALVQESAQNVVDPERHRLDGLDLRGSGPAKCDGVFGVDQRIIQRIRLVIV